MVMKPPKETYAQSIFFEMHAQSILILSMVVILLFVMVCGAYICSIYLNKISTHKKAKFLNIKVTGQPCQAITIEPSDLRFPMFIIQNPKHITVTHKVIFFFFFLIDKSHMRAILVNCKIFNLDL